MRAGRRYACGLRPDNTITCWGGGPDIIHPPAGEFSAVSTGSPQPCALRTDGAVICWGDPRDDPTAAPAGRHTAVAAGEDHTCALRTDGTVACWGEPDNGRTFAPRSAMRDLSVGRYHNCAVDTGGSVLCWGGNVSGQSSPPDGQFSAVGAGGWHSCGLKTDGTVVCWGNNDDGRADAPKGKFKALAAGGSHNCATRPDGTVACWGYNDDGQADAPDGSFIDVAAGSNHSCGVMTDQSVVCWGGNEHGESDAPDGSFSRVDAGHQHSCAVTTDDAVVCWGANWWNKSDAPSGSFKDVTDGGQQACGLRSDDTITCWGVKIVAMPGGAERATSLKLPDPGECRPYGTDAIRVTTAGFPLAAEALPSTGTLNVVVLFVDFPDKRAWHSTYEEAERALPNAERYMESVSYGRLDVQFRPLHRWLRAGKRHDEFLSVLSYGDPAVANEIDFEAVRLADQFVDFADHDLMMVVMPSTHFNGGNAVGTAYTDEGSIPTTRVNTDPRDPSGGRDDWGSTAAHEIFHALGLLDMYPYDSSAHETPSAPFGQAWITADFGAMHLQALFLASEADQRLSFEWRHPYGGRSTGYAYNAAATEMLSWSRWQLGWLDPAQVSCVTEPQATVELRPIAEPDGGTAMAAIPLWGNELIVIESRRKINHDVGVPYEDEDGYTAIFPGLLEEGVLVYTVDAGIGSGDLPMAVAGDTGNGQVSDFPVLGEGQSVTVRGHTITVVSDAGGVHTVEITRQS